MDVFITWAGRPSQEIALILRDWLPKVTDGCSYFVSSEGLKPVKMWHGNLAEALQRSTFVIACITPDNRDSTWLHFESGCVLKDMKKDCLFPIWFEVEEIDQPLGAWQGGPYGKASVFGLVRQLRSDAGHAVDSETLQSIIDEHWPKLNAKIQGIIGNPSFKELVKHRKVSAGALYDDLTLWRKHICTARSALAKNDVTAAKGALDVLFLRVDNRFKKWPL